MEIKVFCYSCNQELEQPIAQYGVRDGVMKLFVNFRSHECVYCTCEVLLDNPHCPTCKMLK